MFSLHNLLDAILAHGTGFANPRVLTVIFHLRSRNFPERQLLLNLPEIRRSNRASFCLSLVAHCKMCSHMRRTRQPVRRMVQFTSRSRAWLRANFFFQNAALPLGLVPCLGQPCQKQPSTNTASRSRLN